MIVNKHVKPFLRWAGGKNWFIKDIQSLLKGKFFNSYFEPFLGGGSVFFNCKEHFKTFHLSDLNHDLINTYQVVRDNVDDLIVELNSLSNNKDDYYHIRQAISADKIKSAARFIYLNQTSFNGIYRVNLNGVYNVPYGFRKTPVFEETHLKLLSLYLNECFINSGDFETIEMSVGVNDLVFLDPPYTVTHNDNGFIKYNQKLFSLADQHRLSKFIDKIKNAGAYYILCNAGHATVKEIFEKDDSLIELQRASLIGGKHAKRGHFSEFVFTNLVP